MHELTYLICAVQRTGSLLLCETLCDTGVAGLPPGGLFRLVTDKDRHPPGITEIQDSVRATATRNGVSGSRMFWNGWSTLLQNARAALSLSDSSDLDVLSELMGDDLRFIWLRRDDKLRQAISFWRATHPKEQFRYPTGPSESVNVPVFDYEKIEGFLRLVSDQDAAWLEWFEANHVSACEVMYEQFAANRRGVAERILDLLEIEHRSVNLPIPNVRQQADENTERYVSLFLEEQDRRSQS